MVCLAVVLALPISAALQAGWRNYTELIIAINNAESNLCPVVVVCGQMLICLFLSKHQHVASSGEFLLRPPTPVLTFPLRGQRVRHSNRIHLLRDRQLLRLLVVILQSGFWGQGGGAKDNHC